MDLSATLHRHRRARSRRRLVHRVRPGAAGCYTQGKTIDEGLARIQEAIAAYIASLRQHDEPIPDEIYAPIVTSVQVA
jgi:hypothetical protein